MVSGQSQEAPAFPASRRLRSTFNQRHGDQERQKDPEMSSSQSDDRLNAHLTRDTHIKKRQKRSRKGLASRRPHIEDVLIGHFFPSGRDFRFECSGDVVCPIAFHFSSYIGENALCVCLFVIFEKTVIPPIRDAVLK
ncbi:hypothetical protein CEXT_473461 [Caerostris extrusa]|uniref:Uncharacterized protein n=1 Tax=Caerostris extrusa TaxID=172846 RepID=A0AAV4V5Z8_CAEEX|nr:hypothetical protein CEXT_473461 [Caerostris extrusa]